MIAALQALLDCYGPLRQAAVAADRDLSGALQKAEPDDDAPRGETDFVWYLGSDENTFGAFAIPREAFAPRRGSRSRRVRRTGSGFWHLVLAAVPTESDTTSLPAGVGTV